MDDIFYRAMTTALANPPSRKQPKLPKPKKSRSNSTSTTSTGTMQRAASTSRTHTRPNTSGKGSYSPATTEPFSSHAIPAADLDYFGERWKQNLQQSQRKAAPHKLSSFNGSPSPPPAFEPSRSESADPAISLYSIRGSTRFKHSERNHVSQQRRHSRNRDDVGRNSAGAEGDSSASSVRSNPHRAHRRKAFSQKAMLSRALQKANHAVLLDNAQNFEGAIEAYEDACHLLTQVMSRSSTEEDKRKLEAVRATYSNRIEELRNTDLLYHGGDAKALPRPPAQGRDSQDQEALSPFRDEDSRREAPPVFASKAWIPPEPQVHRDPPMMVKTQVPPRRQSSLPPLFRYEERSLQAPKITQIGTQQQMQYQTWINLNSKDRTRKPPLTLEPPLFNRNIPPPLSPRRPLSPANLADARAAFIDEPPKPAKQSTTPPVANNEPSDSKYNADQENAEFTSWLDTIDESGNSTSSSVHSRSSSLGLRRKRIRAASGATEAEFDAALDAAVEVAYDDGFEPDDDDDDDDDEEHMSQNINSRSTGQRFVSDARKNVEIAKEMVREAEREAAILLAKDREKWRLQEKAAKRDSIDMDYGDDEEEEEERMLEEMTRDYIMDDFEYDVQSKSALPRQSDSSGFSGRTWASSISNPTTAGTPLSTVAEFPPQPQSKVVFPPSHPPPMGALPPPPGLSTTASPTISNGAESRPPSVNKSNPGVRERRLSGKMKHLKIETNTRVANNSEPLPSGQPLNQAPRTGPMQASFGASKPIYGSTEPQKGTPDLSFSPPSASTSHSFSRRDMLHSNGNGFVDGNASYPVSASLTRAPTGESETSAHSIPSSPGRFASKAVGLRKNFSSSSLRSKGMITASGSDVFESSPTTPSTATHSYSNRKGSLSTTIPILPTPTGANFMIDRPPTGGMYLFESDIHSPTAPGSPNPLAANAPLPLEPCPDSTLLRPFWFLRCIYQTIAHPRGAYISTKLFIPRDIWRVRGIKLKGIEEKISQCDLLSATLQKLAKVDTLNADAVLEEMQFLENVMDQAQANLAKKLGSDVGVVGASALFKSPSVVEEVVLNNNDNATSKATGTNNRSYLSSWRKLRSKGSAAPGPTPATTGPSSREGSREGPTMDSLPMTSMSDPRFYKRDLSRVEYGGPNANYMAALARLCDAVQVLDQIARQVEDPGLKHTSQTHVGLELSMRHASEFFGLYICRFLLVDVSMMLDKYIKRGTEWVLS